MRLFSAFFSMHLALVLNAALAPKTAEAARNLYRDDRPGKYYRFWAMTPFTDYWSISNLTWGTDPLTTPSSWAVDRARITSKLGDQPRHFRRG